MAQKLIKYVAHNRAFRRTKFSSVARELITGLYFNRPETTNFYVINCGEFRKKILL